MFVFHGDAMQDEMLIRTTPYCISDSRSLVFPDLDSPIARAAGENARVKFVEDYPVHRHSVRFVVRPHVNTTVGRIALVYGTLLRPYQENILIRGMECDTRPAS